MHEWSTTCRLSFMKGQESYITSLKVHPSSTWYTLIICPTLGVFYYPATLTWFIESETHRNYRWRSPEEGENFTNSVATTPKFMFECTDPSLRGEVNSNINTVHLSWSCAHKVNLADKFSGAKVARERRTCLQSAPSEVSTLMFTRR